MYKPSAFAKRVGVSVKTLQKWDRIGVLPAKRTITNQRYYTDEDLAAALRLPRVQKERRTVAYCRVSSQAQKPDLVNQRAVLEESDSPYIEAVWRGRAGSEYAPVCPASTRWHLLFLKQNERVNVSVEGPLTRATPVAQAEGTEWFGITFPPGTFLPSVPIRNLLNERAILALAAKTSFELASSSFQFPDYENVETFVERLVREDLLVSDPVVKSVLAGQPPDMSLRTVRRHFLLSTGLTYKMISQIERAKQAADLLEQGVSLLEAAYQAGYADQSHMTRSLKQFIGYTPARIAQIRNPK